MAFLVSPGVLVTEKDLSAIVPAVATTVGATVGLFNWGPINKPYLVSNELQLANTFGNPNDASATSFFTAANFLAYANAMWVIRAKATGVLNAVTGTPGVLIENEEDYEQNHSSGEDSSGEFAAKFAGVKGNGIKVYIADASTFPGWQWNSLFQSAPGTSTYANNKAATTANDEMHIVIVDAEGKFSGTRGTVLEKFAFVSKAIDARSFDGTSSFYKNVINRSSKYLYTLDIPTAGLGVTGNAWATAVVATQAFKPISTSIAVTIIDSGTGTGATAVVTKVGTNGEILEVNVTAGGASYVQGTTTATITGGGGTGATITATVTTGAVTAVVITAAGSGYSDGLKYTLANGADGTYANDAAKASALIAGYDTFKNAETYDISLLPLGHVSPTVANYVISNIAEHRKDCVVFISPSDAGGDSSDFGDIIIGSLSPQLEAIKEYKNLINMSTSYAFMDSGWKYQFDRYNDVYRWVPLNGDIAGLCARTDFVADPWFSPGGFNRGAIKNVVKLATNPDQAFRDELYKVNINPVVSFPNQGTVLYGDKTLQSKPSAFDRINVRRLFIVLEKAISTAAKYQLFEFNDSFTRAQFRAMVVPFLRDIQGRRGLYDFKVICDETNNTGEVIDRNEFVADIFLKPTKSINYVYLNFVATRTDAKFEELVAA